MKQPAVRASLLVMVWLVLAPGEAQECHLVMRRPGNAYYANEPIRFRATVSGPRQTLTYRVFTRSGYNTIAATAGVGLGRTVDIAMPRLLPLGYYTLQATVGATTVVDSFCVIPRPWNEPGDYALFGLHPDDWTPESLTAASQLGVRHVRYGVYWPNSEPQPGQWEWDYIRAGYEAARESGQEMLVIVGYTPRHQAVRADNCHLWVNDAWFTWHIRDIDGYARYMEQLTTYASDKSVQWPPRSIVPAGESPAVTSRPWVRGWEVWNEVDLIFYFGDWNRYGELLRLSFANSRQRTPATPVLYGGSTGNFPAFGMTYSGAARYCFDYNTFHPDGDPNYRLGLWYSGAPQIPYCAGLPRETWLTEAYCTGRKPDVPLEQYQQTPEDLQRLYLTLKAWRQPVYYRSGCTGGWIAGPERPCNGLALLTRRDGHLSPTPLYPAFAAARKLLDDAVYVGPVNLGSTVTAYMYLKYGRPLLAAWSDAGAQATVVLRSGASRLDAMGGQQSLGQARTRQLNLNADPEVILGAADTVYLPEAFRAQYNLLADTYYGVPPWPDCRAWYVKKLGQDVNDWTDPGGMNRLAEATARVARCLAVKPTAAPAALTNAQEVCGALMGQIVSKTAATGGLQYRAGATIGRLGWLAQWLGEVGDGLAVAQGGYQLPGEEYENLGQRLAEAQAGLRRGHPDATVPLADQLLRRARELYAAQAGRRGRGACTTALVLIRTAEQLGATEQAVVLQVVPLVEYPTARVMRKARLLAPGQEHRLQVWVYNYLDHPVSGTLTVTAPDAWTPRTTTVPFAAAPGQPSPPADVMVRLPQEPTPWQRVSSFTLDGMLDLDLPTSLRDRPEVAICGALSDGQVIPEVLYHVNVGNWQPEDCGTALAAGEGPLLARARRDLAAVAGDRRRTPRRVAEDLPAASAGQSLLGANHCVTIPPVEVCVPDSAGPHEASALSREPGP